MARAVVPGPVLKNDRGAFLEGVDPDGQVAENILVQPHLPFHFQDGVRRRVDIQQDIMALTVFLNFVSQSPKAPAFRFDDFAAAIFD